MHNILPPLGPFVVLFIYFDDEELGERGSRSKPRYNLQAKMPEFLKEYNFANITGTGDPTHDIYGFIYPSKYVWLNNLTRSVS